jgi:hypothetical protein
VGRRRWLPPSRATPPLQHRSPRIQKGKKKSESLAMVYTKCVEAKESVKKENKKQGQLTRD